MLHNCPRLGTGLDSTNMFNPATFYTYVPVQCQEPVIQWLLFVAELLFVFCSFLSLDYAVFLLIKQVLEYLNAPHEYSSYKIKKHTTCRRSTYEAPELKKHFFGLVHLVQSFVSY